MTMIMVNKFQALKNMLTKFSESIDIKKLLALMVLIILLCNNEVDAMERTPQQKIDEDIYRELLTSNDYQRFSNSVTGFSPEQLQRINEQITNIANTLVDRVEDNELNIPEDTIPGYTRGIMIFLGLSIGGYLLYRYAGDIWNFVRELVGEIVQHTITPETVMNRVRNLLANPATREAAINLIRSTMNDTSQA